MIGAGKVRFAFEDLDVWQKAVEFAKLVIDLAEKINTDRKHCRLIEQLESASTSIALNIAVSQINDIQLEEIKNFGDEIGKMLSSLISSIKNSINKKL